MPAPSSPPASSLLEHLLGHYQRLEDLLEHALCSGSLDLIEAFWPELVGKVLAHLDAEECEMTLATLSHRAALTTIADHNSIRARLIELTDRIASRILNLETVRSFIDELRAHARRQASALVARSASRVEAEVMSSTYYEAKSWLSARGAAVEVVGGIGKERVRVRLGALTAELRIIDLSEAEMEMAVVKLVEELRGNLPPDTSG